MAAPPIWVEYVNTIPPSRTIVRDVLTAPIETITLGGKGSVGVPTARERTDAKSSVSIELIVSPAIPSIFWYFLTRAWGAPTINTSIFSVGEGDLGLLRTLHTRVIFER